MDVLSNLDDRDLLAQIEAVEVPLLAVAGEGDGIAPVLDRKRSRRR